MLQMLQKKIDFDEISNFFCVYNIKEKKWEFPKSLGENSEKNSQEKSEGVSSDIDFKEKKNCHFNGSIDSKSFRKSSEFYPTISLSLLEKIGW
jgi:hypothetical protein